MAKVTLVRVDDRLIYGQIVNSWMNFSPVKKAVIVDDDIVERSILQDAFRMVMPSSVELKTMTCEEAGKGWKENWLGEIGPIIVLFKNIKSAVKTYHAGFTFDKLEIGDTGRKQGVFVVRNTAKLNTEDIILLEELYQKGVAIKLHHSFDEGASLWSEIRQEQQIAVFLRGDREVPINDEIPVTQQKNKPKRKEKSPKRTKKD